MWRHSSKLINKTLQLYPLLTSPLAGGGTLLPIEYSVKSVPSPAKGRVRVG
jgi:hypothetical protein